MGISPEIAQVTGTYLSSLTFSLIPYAITTCTISFLEAQHIQRPQNIAAVLSMIVHILFCYTFIVSMDLGLAGAGWAITATMSVDALVLITIMKKNSPRSLFPFEAESFKDLKHVVFVGVQSCVLLFAEWWGLEVITFFVAYVGIKELAAHAILFHLEGMFFLVINAIATSNFTMMGSFIGERNREEFHGYKDAVKTAALVAGGILILGVIIFAHPISSLFIFDVEVKNLIYFSLPIIILFFIFDSLETIFEPILKAIGKYHTNIFVSMVGYYVIGFPAMYFLTFTFDFGLHGAWIGLTIGAAAISIAYIYLIGRTNFNEEVDRYNREILREVTKTLETVNPARLENMNGRDLMELFLEKQVKENSFLMSPHNPVVNDFVVRNR